MKIKNFIITISAFTAAICLFQFCGCTGTIQQVNTDFQIVESVPLETAFGSPDIPGTLNTWLEMINGAEKSLDIETFYIISKTGSAMEKVLSAIENAAKRNVNVRIIVDSVFYRRYPEQPDRLNGVNGINMRVISFSKLTGGIMHAKFFIVDGREVFVGSQNLDWRALEHIHEIGARILEPEIARTFLEVFETDWELCKSSDELGAVSAKPKVVKAGKMRAVTAGNPVTIKSKNYGKLDIYPAFSPKSLLAPGLSWELDELLKLIDDSKKEILIQVMSFSPFKYKKKGAWHAIDNALKKAAKKGVKIKLLLSDWTIRKNTVGFMKKLWAVPNLELRIITIPQHSSGFIPFSRVDHSKYMVVDGNRSIITTSNWEWGYFHESRDAALVITGRPVGKKLSDIFYRSWDSPYSLSFDPKKKYKPPRRAK